MEINLEVCQISIQNSHLQDYYESIPDLENRSHECKTAHLYVLRRIKLQGRKPTRFSALPTLHMLGFFKHLGQYYLNIKCVSEEY